MKHLKFIILIAFVISIISCADDDKDSNNRDCVEVDYGKEFNLRLSDEVCFPDGNSFEVKVISDEFCCCFCICAWEGELEIMVETTNQDGDKDLLSFGSSTYNLKDKIFDGYKVSKIEYLYNGEPDALPLCEGEYDSKNVELIFEVSAS